MADLIRDIPTDVWLTIDAALIDRGYYNSGKSIKDDKIHYEYQSRTGFGLPTLLLVVDPA